MRSILYIVALVLFIGWLLGYVGFGAAVGNFIHIALVLAVIALIFALIRKV